MKTKQILIALFWSTLFVGYTYLFWTYIAPDLQNNPRNETRDPGFFASFFLMFWFGSMIVKKINRIHPKMTLAILCFSSLLSPFWFIAIGLIWLCIQGVRKVGIFFKTTNWAI